MNEVNQIILPEGPVAPPREVSGLADRRAWTEPGVRVWWMLAIVILLIVAVYAVDRFWAWHVQNRLIVDGTLVSAKVASAGGLTIENENVAADSAVALTFDWKGKPQQVVGFLEGRPAGNYITIGKMVPIRVDPDDPTVWTYRTENTILIHELFVGLIVLPLAPILAGVAIYRRKKVLQTLRHGEAALAVVSERRQTPIAPLSYMVRCSLRDRPDRRIHVVHVPRGGAVLGKGDLLWVLLPPVRNGPMVAMMWFE